MAAAGLVAVVVAASTVVAMGGVVPRAFDAGMVVAFLVIGLLGTLLARRRPGHRIGPLLVATAAPIVLWGLAVAWSEAARLLALPMVGLASWARAWLWIPSVTMLALTILLFPTGEPPSRRWRYVPHAMAGHVLATVVVAGLLLPGWDATAAGAGAPSGVDGGTVLEVVGNVPIPLLLLVSCIALVARFRRAEGVERLQLRWLRLAMLGLVAVTLLPFGTEHSDPVDVVWYAVGVQLAVLAIPAAMTLAVLRYRLYDIDRLVSRVVAYAIVVAVAAIAYLGLVLTLGAVARAATGEAGDLVVALSTLATAALVQPVRRRVLRQVERRFNRARYDANRVVEDFVRELRDHVDVAAVRDDLCGAAREILEPAAVGVWVPPPENRP